MKRIKLLSDKRFRFLIKTLVFFIISITACKCYFSNGVDNFKLEKTYSYQNDFNVDSIQIINFSATIEQQFISKGNTLSNIKIYIAEVSGTDGSLTISLSDAKGNVIKKKAVEISELSEGKWNTFSMDVTGLKRGDVYMLAISADKPDNRILSVIDRDSNTDLLYLSSCFADGQKLHGKLALGINQVYYYFDAAHMMYLLINVMFLACLLGIIAVSILKFEDGAAVFKMQGLNKSSLYSALITISFLFMFNPMDQENTEIQKFNRIMGAGIMSGYDVTRVIRNFMCWILAAAILYVLISTFTARLSASDYAEQQSEAWNFLDKFMVIAGANLLFRCITFFYNGGGNEFYYSSWIVILVFLSTFAYIFCGIHEKISFYEYQTAMILLFAVSFPTAILVNAQWQNGMLLLDIQWFLIMALVLSLRFVKPVKILYKKGHSLLWAGTIVASFFPMVLSVYIEAVNVLVGKGIFVTNLRGNYALIVLIMFFVAIVLFAALRKQGRKLPDAKLFAYPSLIAGVAMLSQQIPLTNTYSADLFEGANAGILISDFLNFGDIPVVQHYGGHMMTSVWEGILYGLVNNDSVGAVFSPYSGLVVPIIAIAFFYFLKEISEVDIAFGAALLFPFYSSVSYMGLGLLAALAAVKFVQKNTYLRAILLWLSCTWITLYRLDLGYAFDIACVIALLCYVIHEKNGKAMKQLGITLAGYGAVFGVLWCVLCVIKGVNPARRLLEFLMISASNQNWAYNNIGNTGNTMYAWCYVIVPLFISISLVYVILSEKFRGKTGMVRWMMLIILGTSYFANFSRGLVRHSLAETALGIVLWTGYLYMALLFTCFIKREYFLFIFTGFILFNTLLRTDAVFAETGLADAAVGRITSFRDSWTLTRFDYEDHAPNSKEAPKTYWECLSSDEAEIDRVVIEKTLFGRVKPLKQLCEVLLDEDETFIDFMNRTMTYCLLERKNPVYVSQSPLQLSGDYSQECFVEEIAKNPDKNPIVIMPYYNNNVRASSSLDGLSNTYRYYRVSEYLYQNYRPLCHNDEYALWCLSSRYEEMMRKIVSAADYDGIECIDGLKKGKIKYKTSNLNVSSDGETVVLAYTGTDPIIAELQNYMDLTPYEGAKVKIKISYESDVLGRMQMFYTETSEENYTEDKVVNYQMAENQGIASFVIPVTEHTRIRLDIPEGSNVKLNSLKYGSTIELIEYGYDRFEDISENAIYVNDKKSLHIYGLNMLPLIWGEMDKGNAKDNPILSGTVKEGQYWKIENMDFLDKTAGNYLLFNLEYAGIDGPGYTKTEDESSAVTVRIGKAERGKFIELYRYTLMAKEGKHDYLIRISNDYYWYLENTDMISIERNAQVKVNDVIILQGD